jgi:hypothetical protein
MVDITEDKLGSVLGEQGLCIFYKASTSTLGSTHPCAQWELHVL